MTRATFTTVYTTPRTTLRWSTLEQWYEAALALEARRSSSLNSLRKELHVRVLPLDLIHRCSSPATLYLCRALLRDGPPSFRQPLRGQRTDAPHTVLIVALNNRRTQIERDADRASIPIGHNSRTMQAE